jgi:nucleotide-binding universal stress UspA family protein
VHSDPALRELDPDAVFTTILVGIDDTPESLVAAVQANALRASAGRLVLLAVAERYLAAHAGLAAGHASALVASTTTDDLARAERLVHADETLVAAGRLVPVLRGECARRGATLIAIGGRPHRRLAALALGGHDEEALASPECSVLLARPGWGPRRPDRIVLSAGAGTEDAWAGAVAHRLADRLGCELLAVVGLEDAHELDVIRDELPDAVLEPCSQVDAVARAATPQSLVVVGRDPGGRTAQRVAYAATCSVLVVHEGGAELTARQA